MTAEAMRSLLRTEPFVPFRLHTADGDQYEVWNREQGFVTDRIMIVGRLPDEDPDDQLPYQMLGLSYIVRVDPMVPYYPGLD